MQTMLQTMLHAGYGIHNADKSTVKDITNLHIVCILICCDCVYIEEKEKNTYGLSISMYDFRID